MINRNDHESASRRVWQDGHSTGGSVSTRVPQRGQTRFSQQAGSPGLSSSAGSSTGASSACRAVRAVGRYVLTVTGIDG